MPSARPGKAESDAFYDLPPLHDLASDQARRLDAFTGSVLLLKALRRHHPETQPKETER